MENEIKLAYYVNGYITTPIFLTYIKLLYKINTCVNKFIRTQKEIYLQEIKNIFHTINNKINIYKMEPSLLLYYVDDDYKEIVKNIMEWE